MWYKYPLTILFIFDKDASFLSQAELAGTNPNGPRGFSLSHFAGYLLPSAGAKLKQEISHARSG